MISKVKLLGIAAIAAGSFYLGSLPYKAAMAEMERNLAQEQVKAQNALTESKNAKELLTLQSAELDALRIKQREVIEREVIKEVIRYEEMPSSGQCTFTADFVRIHNAAAGSNVSSNADTATKPNDKPRRIKAATDR